MLTHTTAVLCFLNDTPDTFTQAKSRKCFSTRTGIVMARHSCINTTWSIFVRFKGYIFLTMHVLMHVSNSKGTESIYLSGFCNPVEQILHLLDSLTTLSPTSCEVNYVHQPWWKNRSGTTNESLERFSELWSQTLQCFTWSSCGCHS